MYCIWACLCMYLCASECNVYVCECVFVRVWWRGLFEMLREWLWKTGAFLLWATLVNPALQLNGLGWTCTRNNLFRLWMATKETPPSLTCTLWDPTRKCLRTCFTDKMLSVFPIQCSSLHSVCLVRFCHLLLPISSFSLMRRPMCIANVNFLFVCLNRRQFEGS